MTRIHSRTPFPGSLSQRVASNDGEASGLIDIRTMGAVLATDTRAEVPNFGGLAISSTLAPTQPQLQAERPVTGRVAAVPRSQGPMLTLLAVLTLGVVGLAGYVVTLPAPQGAPVVHVIPRDALASNQSVKETPKPEPEVAAEPEALAPTEPDRPATKPGKPRPGKPKPGESIKAEPDKPAPVVDAPKPKADYGVDCILGKASCGDKPVEKVATPDKPVQAQSDLPEKLEQADISAGTSAARASAASACARLAKGGEKVQVKLSIAGPTGSVVGVSALEDAGNPQLAACVAGELKQASFKKVQKQQMGTVVTVKF